MRYGSSTSGCAPSWRAPRAALHRRVPGGRALPCPPAAARYRAPACTPGAARPAASRSRRPHPPRPLPHRAQLRRPPRGRGAGAAHLQLGRLHRLRHHRAIRARDRHQGGLRPVRLERDAGGEAAGRRLGLRHRQHHHGAFTAARSARASTSRSTSRSYPTGRTSIPACSPCRRRPIQATAMPCPYLHAMNGFAYNVAAGAQRACRDAPTRQPGHAVQAAGDRALRRLRRELPRLAGRRDAARARVPAPAIRTRAASTICRRPSGS